MAHTIDSPTLTEAARARQAAVLLTICDGCTLRYFLTSDPGLLPEHLPAGTTRVSLTCLDLAWFDDAAQLVIDTFTGRWFGLEDVLRAVPLNRAARRREERGQ